MSQTYGLAATILPKSRQRILLDELRHAIERTDSAVLQRWGTDAAKMLGSVFARRARNIGRTVTDLLTFARREMVGAVAASRQGRGIDHLQARGRRAVEVMTFAGQRAIKAGRELTNEVCTSPKEAAPKLAIATLAFLAASGGVDGDGGVPDLDLLAGIDAHRSIFTHSIISGAVIETLLGSTATLVGIIHHNLPPVHDEIWDTINKHKDRYLHEAAKGASLGVAYHLFIDATIEPGAYHDLPVELPIQGHQAIAGANAAAEAVDVARRDEQHIVQRCPSCGHQLRFPLGKLMDARCVPCGHRFRVRT